jgi:hypothetical protein
MKQRHRDPSFIRNLGASLLQRDTHRSFPLTFPAL